MLSALERSSLSKLDLTGLGTISVAMPAQPKQVNAAGLSVSNQNDAMEKGEVKPKRSYTRRSTGPNTTGIESEKSHKAKQTSVAAGAGIKRPYSKSASRTSLITSGAATKPQKKSYKKKQSPLEDHEDASTPRVESRTAYMSRRSSMHSEIAPSLSAGSSREYGSSAVDDDEVQPDCKHDCRHEPKTQQVFSNGMVIECRKCLENFNAQANRLLLLVQRTFEEMDMAKAEKAEAQTGILSAAAFRVGDLEMPQEIHATLQTSRETPSRILPLSTSKPVATTAISESVDVTVEANGHQQGSTTIPSLKEEEEAGIAADCETIPTNHNDGDTEDESIHVESVTFTNDLAAGVASPPPSVRSARDVSNISQASSDDDAQSPTSLGMPRNTLSAAKAEPPSQSHSSTGKKRKLTDLSHILNESGNWSNASGDPIDQGIYRGESAFHKASPTSSHETGETISRPAFCSPLPPSRMEVTVGDETEIEESPVPKRRSIDYNTERKPGSPDRSVLFPFQTPNPAQHIFEKSPQYPHPQKQYQPASFFQANGYTLPPVFTHSSHNLGIVTAKAPAVPIPRSVASDLSSHPVIVKRPRGRPRKQRPDNPQASPIAIQPKPNATRAQNLPPPTPTTTFVVDPSGIPSTHTGPVVPRRRGRPPKAKIPLSPATVINPSAEASPLESPSGNPRYPEESQIVNRLASYQTLPLQEFYNSLPYPPPPEIQSPRQPHELSLRGSNVTPSTGGWTAINTGGTPTSAPQTPATAHRSISTPTSSPTTPNGGVKKPRGRPHLYQPPLNYFLPPLPPPSTASPQPSQLQQQSVTARPMQGETRQQTLESFFIKSAPPQQGSRLVELKNGVKDEVKTGDTAMQDGN